MNYKDYLDNALEETDLPGEIITKQDILLEVGSLLKRVRRYKGISQKQLAEKTHISQANISLLENGKYNISLVQLSKLLEACDATMKVGVIINGEELY